MKSWRVTGVLFLLVFLTMLAFVVARYIERDTRLDRELAHLPDAALAGFERCDVSEELKRIEDTLIARGEPVEKRQGIWVYAARGQFMSIPIHRLEIGVCNDDGGRDCGWAYYTGLVVAQPMDAARRSLKKHSGIDYAVAAREEEYEATTRPLLTITGSASHSLMFCDSGSL